MGCPLRVGLKSCPKNNDLFWTLLEHTLKHTQLQRFLVRDCGNVGQQIWPTPAKGIVFADLPLAPGKLACAKLLGPVRQPALTIWQVSQLYQTAAENVVVRAFYYSHLEYPSGAALLKKGQRQVGILLMEKVHTKKWGKQSASCRISSTMRFPHRVEHYRDSLPQDE